MSGHLFLVFLLSIRYLIRPTVAGGSIHAILPCSFCVCNYYDYVLLTTVRVARQTQN